MPEDTVTICRQLTATNLRRSDLERFRSRQKEWSSGWLVASAFRNDAESAGRDGFHSTHETRKRRGLPRAGQWPT